MKLTIRENFDSIGSNEVIFTPDFDDFDVTDDSSLDIDFTPDFDVYGNAIGSEDSVAVCADCGNEICTCQECEEEFDMYECLEALGFIFMMASNDIHTIHVNACGENFKELHESADELYKLLNEYSDTCLEMCCEDGHYIHNLNNAKDCLTQWSIEVPDCESWNIKDGTKTIIDILHDVTISIAELYPDCPSDIQSIMDEWTRTLNSKMNYFLNRVVEVNHIFSQTNESMMSQYIVKNRRKRKGICEHLEKLKLGQSYTMFCQVEDHIDDYNVDPITLKEGDYIIRDFQFGHLPNGGNKGYIPYKVNAVVYDDVSDKSGYYDRRTRLELTDDIDDPFYIVVQNDRFNGMFHKLKKSSIQK